MAIKTIYNSWNEEEIRRESFDSVSKETIDIDYYKDLVLNERITRVVYDLYCERCLQKNVDENHWLIVQISNWCLKDQVKPSKEMNEHVIK